MNLMTTAELATYLRLGERRIYQLVSDDEIPRIRVGGKLLFPRELVDQWLARHLEGRQGVAFTTPPVFAGSEDVLLDRAIRESDCGLSVLYVGSSRGVRRLVDGEARIAGLHLIDAETGEYNVPARCGCGEMPDLVTIEWAQRQQGLMLAPDNPYGITGLGDLAEGRVQVQRRQRGAGADLLLRYLLARADIPFEAIRHVAGVALSDSDLAGAIARGEADCGVGIEAVARAHGLHFIPLQVERYDLALRRRDYFEPAVQRLLDFAHSADFQRMAAHHEGYDVRGVGRVVHNA